MKPPREKRTVDFRTVLIALIAAIPPTVASVAAVIISLNTNAKVEVVHKATNSLTEKLVSVTRTDALQEGHADGVKDEKAREQARKQQEKKDERRTER